MQILKFLCVSSNTQPPESSSLYPPDTKQVAWTLLARINSIWKQSATVMVADLAVDSSSRNATRCWRIEVRNTSHAGIGRRIVYHTNQLIPDFGGPRDTRSFPIFA